MCDGCKRETYTPLNPIFTQLTLEFQAQRKRLPWMVSWKPSGTIGVLSECSTGIEPAFSATYTRRFSTTVGPVT